MSAAEDTQHSFCSVPTPTTIYAGPRTKADFDRIALPVTVHEWKADAIVAAIRGDGRQYESRIHSKWASDKASGIDVIFQWSEVRVAEKVSA